MWRAANQIEVDLKVASDVNVLDSLAALSRLWRDAVYRDGVQG